MSRTGEALSSLRHAAGRAAQLLGFLERRCTLCHAPFEDALPDKEEVPHAERVLPLFFCPDCRRKLRRRTMGFCPYCGEPSALEEAPCQPCQKCLRKLPPWREFFFFGVYGGLLREVILRAKFGGSLACLNALDHILAALCEEQYEVSQKPDVIVPMPLDEERLRRRGYNQCREMVRYTSKILHVPVRTDILIKTQKISPQAMMKREQRLALGQPFAAKNAEGLFILLVDDICTTGTTMERAAECLLAAGALRVDAAVLARASQHENHGGGEKTRSLS